MQREARCKQAVALTPVKAEWPSYTSVDLEKSKFRTGLAFLRSLLCCKVADLGSVRVMRDGRVVGDKLVAPLSCSLDVLCPQLRWTPGPLDAQSLTTELVQATCLQI